jgi:hypothetical protein
MQDISLQVLEGKKYIIGVIHMRNKSRYPQRNQAIFPRKYFMVHRFEQELSRFNLKGVT